MRTIIFLLTAHIHNIYHLEADFGAYLMVYNVYKFMD